MNQKEAPIYHFVENLYHYLPRGLEDEIIEQITNRVNEEATADDIIVELEEQFSSQGIDAKAIVNTIFVGLENVHALTILLDKFQKDYKRLYVVGVTPDKEPCEWCKEHVDGKIFRLIADPEKEPETDLIEDPVFGEIPQIWPSKSYNDETRWVRTDFQHINCTCGFNFFDPFVDKYDAESKSVELLADGEEPEYTIRAYLVQLEETLIEEEKKLKKMDNAGCKQQAEEIKASIEALKQHKKEWLEKL